MTVVLHRTRHRASIGGFSLLEMMLMVSISGLVFGIAVTGILGALRASDAAKSQQETVQGLLGLERQFRADVRTASKASDEPGEPGKTAARLSLMQPEGRRVDYYWEGDRVSRLLFAGDKLVAHDSFRLEARPTVRWRVEPMEGGRQRVVLVIGGSDEGEKHGREFRLAAITAGDEIVEQKEEVAP